MLNAFLYLVIRGALFFAALSNLMAGKLELGMLFLVMGELFSIQNKLDSGLKVLVSKKDLEKMNDEQN